MNKALLLSILLIFCRPQTFGFFSQFVVITPDLKGHEKYQPWFYQNNNEPNFVTVIFPNHSGDRAYWLVHSKLPLPDEELNFRSYIWNDFQPLPEKLSSITQLSGHRGRQPNSESFLKFRIRKSELSNYYVYYDHITGVDGGGYFRTFRLSSYPISKEHDWIRRSQMEAFVLDTQGSKEEAREKLKFVEHSLINPEAKKELDSFDAERNKPLPSRVTNFQRWKLQLPENTDRSGNPDEVKPPELSQYSHPEYFFLTENSKAVVFRAPCGGATTKNSHYPRSELREMTEDGKERASWSTTRDDYHVMSVKLSITALPDKKPHVVCAQVHDGKSDLLAVRIEGRHLFIYRDDYPKLTLDAGYKLGRPFDLEICSGKGRIIVTYEGRKVLDWEVEQSECYYKVGCYTQSNVKRGDLAEAYGETRLYHLWLHETTKP